VIREVVDWLDIPSSVLDLISLGRLEICDKFELIWIKAGAVMWSLWNICNKLIFYGKLIKHPADAIFQIISLLQVWRPLWDDNMGEFLRESRRR
jgi:hypothetical protein